MERIMAKRVLILSDRIGRADEELAVLMKNFFTRSSQ
jgi:hypothetical protein